MATAKWGRDVGQLGQVRDEDVYCLGINKVGMSRYLVRSPSKGYMFKTQVKNVVNKRLATHINQQAGVAELLPPWSGGVWLYSR